MSVVFDNARRALQFLDPISVPEGLDGIDGLKTMLEARPLHTLLTRDFFDAMMALARTYGERLSFGNWVQVGVWRGGGALFLKALMTDIGCQGVLHLYDTFEQIPIDGLNHGKDRAFVDGFSPESLRLARPGSVESVRKVLSDCALSKDVVFHKGDILQDVGEGPANIALLHLDVDFYEPTFRALELFFDRVVPGGVILIDDYYMDLLDCRQAVNDFLAERGIARSSLKRFSSYSARLTKPL